MAWEYPTNYSNGSVVSGPGDFFIGYPSSIIPEFGGGILTMLFIVVFATSSFMGAKKALLTSCFITGIISMFFAVRGWINELVPISFGAVTIIIIILFLLEGDGGGL
jgi:nucleoside recognition membrane protein YjiH